MKVAGSLCTYGSSYRVQSICCDCWVLCNVMMMCLVFLKKITLITKCHKVCFALQRLQRIVPIFLVVTETVGTVIC